MTVDLAYTETGHGPPLIVLHGLFGSKRNWASIARRLSADYRVLTVDLRNHGESPWDPAMDYPTMAEDVARLVRRHAGGRATLVGHSMGGKVAMTLALEDANLVDRLAVVDIAPATSGSDLLGYIRHMRALDIERFSRRSEVEAALAEAIETPAIRAFLAHNVQSDDGGLRWQLNLEAIEERFDDILDFPDYPHGHSYRKPTVFIVGAASDYVQPHHHAEIERLFPKAGIDVVPGAGHWVHAEQPSAFVDRLTAFLES